MPKFIEWKSMQPLREGWNGCLGDERIWAVIPVGGRKHEVAFAAPDLQAGVYGAGGCPNGQDEGKHIGDMSVARFLRRTRLMPATDEQIDEVIPSYRNHEAEQDYRRCFARPV